MRLLNTKSLELKAFPGKQVPDYAILSHTWGKDEITFEEAVKQPLGSWPEAGRQQDSFAKILGTCR